MRAPSGRRRSCRRQRAVLGEVHGTRPQGCASSSSSTSSGTPSVRDTSSTKLGRRMRSSKAESRSLIARRPSGSRSRHGRPPSRARDRTTSSARAPSRTQRGDEQHTRRRRAREIPDGFDAVGVGRVHVVQQHERTVRIVGDPRDEPHDSFEREQPELCVRQAGRRAGVDRPLGEHEAQTGVERRQRGDLGLHAQPGTQRFRDHTGRRLTGARALRTARPVAGLVATRRVGGSCRRRPRPRRTPGAPIAGPGAARPENGRARPRADDDQAPDVCRQCACGQSVAVTTGGSTDCGPPGGMMISADLRSYPCRSSS